jgi:hypothetical protein
MAPQIPKIPECPTVRQLGEEIWHVVCRRDVDTAVAIEALEQVLVGLRIDQQVDEEMGWAPKGKPS